MSAYVASSLDDDDPLAPIPELRQAAYEQLGETYQLRQQCLQAIQEKITLLSSSEQQRFRGFFIDTNRDIIRYIRGCKFNIDKTWKKMMKTIDFHEQYPQYSHNITAKEFQSFQDVIYLLQRKDTENRKLYALRSKYLLQRYREDPHALPSHCLARLNIYMFQQFTYDPYIQIYGVGLMNTFRDISMWDTMTLTSITPLAERTAVFHYLQHCIPLRIGHVYIIEEPFYIRWVFNMASIVLSKKLMERFHLINQDYDFFATHLQLSCCQDINHKHGPQCLPKCLGGEGNEEALPWIPMCMEAEANKASASPPESTSS